ncbi:PQQ-like beta-propeller repeat protein [Candidatus Bathyarchaeota archaeon]|nr:PQQ-like beta-propeller repeat protein [Candidatus Bathyarchaeota archaeon]
MNFKRDKRLAIAFSLILMFAMAISVIALPAVTAQEEAPEVPSYPFINAIPNPVGVGQTVTLHVGSLWPCGTSSLDGWEGLQVIIEKDGESYDTIDDIKTDSTGGTGKSWTPDEAGTYTLQTYFPEQIAPVVGGFFQANPPSNAIMLEGHSEELELVVQEEPVEWYPGHPLPTEYWSRPIDAQLREWAPIAGNWLGDQVSMDASPPAQTLYYDYNDDAPETAHVLWAKRLTMGGIAGGSVGDQGFDQGDAYEPKWTGAVIIGGIVFYNQFETTGSETGLYRPVVAVDLHTGEELWKQQLLDLNGDNQNLDFGQVFYFDGFNQHGVFDFLWTTASGGTWNAYDPITGRWVYTMQGVPSGTRMYGPKGEIFVYTVNQNAGWMTLWNSARVVSPPVGGVVAEGSWNPQGRTYDADATALGIEWNVTIDTGLPGSVDKVREGIILGTNCDKYTRTDNGVVAYWAIGTDDDNRGDTLYNRTFSVPYVGHYDVQDADVESDVFVISGAESRQHWGFRLSTGEKIWGPTEEQPYQDNWGYSSSNSWDNLVDGRYISGNYGGIVYCRNATTGETIWTYTIDDPYVENLQHNYWRFRPAFFADGKAYFENTEHNPYDPQHRGCPFLCLDLETGERVFEIPYRGSEWSSTPIIGDSIIAMYNEYDQRIYAMGKGPSATTVSIMTNVVTDGDNVLVQGTVTDISPGTEQYALRARFPNGVPAVSDDNMSDWMLYVYNQFEKPADVMGVDVVVEVLDSNGNFYEVGTATSDATGNFVVDFTPPVPGLYTVYATFAGSKSYYSSSAETFLKVNEAPAETPPPTPVPQAPVETYFAASTIGIIIAIAVVGIVLVMMLKKR